jgi:hypothetical protein
MIQKKKMASKVVAVSTRYSISRELIKVADNFIDLNSLRGFVSGQEKSPAFTQGGRSNLSTAKASVSERRKDVN